MQAKDTAEAEAGASLWRSITADSYEVRATSHSTLESQSQNHGQKLPMLSPRTLTYEFLTVILAFTLKSGVALLPNTAFVTSPCACVALCYPHVCTVVPCGTRCRFPSPLPRPSPVLIGHQSSSTCLVSLHVAPSPVLIGHQSASACLSLHVAPIPSISRTRTTKLTFFSWQHPHNRVLNLIAGDCPGRGRRCSATPGSQDDPDTVSRP